MKMPVDQTHCQRLPVFRDLLKGRSVREDLPLRRGKRFRLLLESGDTVDPAELYRQFKGADPDINALMRRDGIIK